MLLRVMGFGFFQVRVKARVRVRAWFSAPSNHAVDSYANRFTLDFLPLFSALQI